MTIRHRHEIDGLRGIAVLAVVLFHAGAPLSGGFVGVDVFFVISGFLITGILLRELEEGHFSIAGFYERRARRILPALALVVVLCAPMALMILMPPDYRDFAKSILATATFTSNHHFWKQSGYFDTSAELLPLQHTWSLAVEEQFYLVFPLVLYGLWRLRLKAWLAPVLGLAALASLGLAEIALRQAPSAAFFLFPTRAWELLVGALSAIWAARHREALSDRRSGQLALVGLVLIAASFVAYDHLTALPGIAALLPCGGTALVLVNATGANLAGTMLGWRPLVAAGLVSYSAYLWHKPIFAFLAYSQDVLSAADRMAAVVMTFLLAALTWKFVETPFRDRRFLLRKTVLGGSAVALMLLAAIGIDGILRDGYPARGVRLTAISALDYEEDNRRLRDLSWADLRKQSASDAYGVENNPYDLQPWFRPDDPRLNVLVVGNSYSKDVWNILSVGFDNAHRFEFARYGAQIADLRDDRRFLGSPNFVESDVVLLASRYSWADVDAIEVVAGQILGRGKRLAIVGPAPEWPEFRGGLLTLADQVVRAGVADGSVVPAIAALSDRVHWLALTRRTAPHPAEAVIRRIVARWPQIIVLDRRDLACDRATGTCLSLDDRLNKVYYDRGHVTVAGALLLGQRAAAIGWLDRL